MRLTPYRFVRFASIHALVSFAVRADAALNALNEPECQPLLSLARMPTDRASKTSLGHGAVSFRDGAHGRSLRLSFSFLEVLQKIFGLDFGLLKDSMKGTNG